ncbi:MAG: ion transporter [Acidobacteriota bacterium]|nr:ion transporter [Acidobacteriota bacterium]
MEKANSAPGNDDAKVVLNREREEILERLEGWLETPLLVLGFVWLALLVIEFIWQLSPFLETVSNVIWIIFIVDFALKFALAPRKTEYLKSNWLTAVALLIPALRVFRIFRVVRVLRAARIARGLRLVRIITSLNRGMGALGASMGRRGFGYVLALTAIVLVSGAAGMYAFENETEGGFRSYGESLWWTAMLLTSIGSDYFPRTPEGRVLCLLLGIYGFCIFGYVTATLATFFVERDASSKDSAIVDAGRIESLQTEISALREEIRLLGARLNK